MRRTSGRRFLLVVAVAGALSIPAAPASAGECREVTRAIEICTGDGRTCVTVGGMPPSACVDHPPHDG